MYKSKKPNVSSSTVRRHYNEDSEASVQSCSRHQKRNTNAMSFVHRVMNAACFCVCVTVCVCNVCARLGGFVRRSANSLRVAPPRGEKTECAKPLAEKKKKKRDCSLYITSVMPPTRYYRACRGSKPSTSRRSRMRATCEGG